jgi:hypothetical protein
LSVNNRAIWAGTASSPPNHWTDEITDLIVLYNVTPEIVQVCRVPVVRALEAGDDKILAAAKDLLDCPPIGLEVWLCHSGYPLKSCLIRARLSEPKIVRYALGIEPVQLMTVVGTLEF